MKVLRLLGEGTAGIAVSVLFTLGMFPLLPLIGIVALGIFGVTAFVGLLFLWAVFWVPSLIIGCIFLRRNARIFGLSMIATGLVISVWIQLWALGIAPLI